MNNMSELNVNFAQQQLAQLNVNHYTSLIDGFERSCKNYADQVAFSCVGQDLHYADLERHSRNFAAYLITTLGLEKGDRVAIQLPNCNQYPVVAWGIMRAGLILVNTNPLYTEREIKHQFNDSGAKAVVVLKQLLPMIEKVIDATQIEHVVVAEVLPFGLDQAALETQIKSVQTLSAALVEGAQGDYEKLTLSMDDVVMLQYTGGTTGAAKGAILTQGNLFASSTQTQNAIPVDASVKEISIAPMPLYHIYGFTWNLVSCCLTGVQSVLIPNARDIDGLVQTMKAYPFTGFSGVNTLFVGLLQHPEFDDIDFTHLGGTISGGAALVSSIADEWERRTGTELFEGYALSETTSALSCNIPDHRQLGTVGKILPSTQVKVVSPEGETLGCNAEGELLVRGPQVTQGYWGQAETTNDTFDSEGWFKTGDVAVIDDEGYIRIVDRIKDMILVSGFNVYPNEVEDIVSSHPNIVECAVVGVADERTAEAVKVFAVKANEHISEQQLRDYCRLELTAYKVPKYVEFVAELPKSNVGKILRRELRDKKS
jgi:long-chain acyl-CoA synthetase